MYADITSQIDIQNNLLKTRLQVIDRPIVIIKSNSRDINLTILMKQRQVEEAERLRKIQEAIEIEREHKSDEEKRNKEEEDSRQRLFNLRHQIVLRKINSFFFSYCIGKSKWRPNEN